jgi:hypothetical protein
MATTSKTSSGRDRARSRKKTSGSTSAARKSKLNSKSKPSKLTLRAYQVGFGDCFLLSFQYRLKANRTEERHVLIDFGSTENPPDAPRDLMLRIAEDIRKTCNGKLHAVVATHRHKDHISGFTTNDKGNAPGNIIAACKPEVVIQPWTEDPEAKRNATKPTKLRRKVNAAFLASMGYMHAVSNSALAEASHLRPGGNSNLFNQLVFLAKDNEGDKNLKNKSAIDNLNSMAKENFYVSFGSKSGLETILPSVKTHVIGPPTLEQTEEIKKEARKHEEFWTLQEEFWMLQADAGSGMRSDGGQLFPGFQSPYSHQRTPLHTRRFIRQLNNLRATQLLQIVRILDDAMNNTSIILLFEIGDHKLLFPGDAQIEDWNYALRDAPEKERKKIHALLEDVSLYKVGHHASLNATPHTLWDMFRRRRDKHPRGDLQTIVSTLEGKHGSQDNDSEVPRRKLVKALKKGSEYFSTQELNGDDELCKVFSIDL